MDPRQLCPSKGLVLPNNNIDDIALRTRTLLICLWDSNMSKLSPFAIRKALTGIVGEPKSVKRLRSGDLLVETISAVQSKAFLLAKSFLDFPVTVAKSSISTATQTDEKITQIICLPLKLLHPTPKILSGGSPSLGERVVGVSPLLSIGWWYLSSVSPKRHCYKVSAADKGCRVYPLDPRPDAVTLYSECTPGKRHACILPDDRHTASLVGLRGGWMHARMKL
ncbi:uncharacterized protein TNCV_3615931 [Trichonephila clavipes]|nr:uncharacterized protein TNCV_3615931 [Trichonephila clavipes]